MNEVMRAGPNPARLVSSSEGTFGDRRARREDSVKRPREETAMSKPRSKFWNTRSLTALRENQHRPHLHPHFPASLTARPYISVG